jgi:hypothetical protein
MVEEVTGGMTMTILTFLGVVDICESDNYGTIQLRLAFDLLESVRLNEAPAIIKAKARNIIQVCCEPMFDDLILKYEWDHKETKYADQILVKCMEVWVTELLTLANRRIKHKRKHERRTKLGIEDLQLAVIMSLLMDVCHEVEDQLETTFIQDHGAMNFS